MNTTKLANVIETFNQQELDLTDMMWVAVILKIAMFGFDEENPEPREVLVVSMVERGLLPKLDVYQHETRSVEEVDPDSLPIVDLEPTVGQEDVLKYYITPAGMNAIRKSLGAPDDVEVTNIGARVELNNGTEGNVRFGVEEDKISISFCGMVPDDAPFATFNVVD